MLKFSLHFLIKLMLALQRAHVVWGVLMSKVLGAKLSYQTSFLCMCTGECPTHGLQKMHRWQERRLGQA